MRLVIQYASCARLRTALLLGVFAALCVADRPYHHSSHSPHHHRGSRHHHVQLDDQEDEALTVEPFHDEGTGFSSRGSMMLETRSEAEENAASDLLSDLDRADFKLDQAFEQAAAEEQRRHSRSKRRMVQRDERERVPGPTLPATAQQASSLAASASSSSAADQVSAATPGQLAHHHEKLPGQQAAAEKSSQAGASPPQGKEQQQQQQPKQQPNQQQQQQQQHPDKRNASQSVFVTGATGVNAGAINGKFVSTGGLYNGKFLYRKEGDSERWLRYVVVNHLNQWRISSTAGMSANDDHGYAYSIDSDLTDPSEASGWYVWDGHQWQMQRDMKVEAEGANVTEASGGALTVAGARHFLSPLLWSFMELWFIVSTIASCTAVVVWTYTRWSQGRPIIPSAASLRDKLPSAALPTVLFLSNWLPRKSSASASTTSPSTTPPAAGRNKKKSPNSTNGSGVNDCSSSSSGSSAAPAAALARLQQQQQQQQQQHPTSVSAAASATAPAAHSHRNINVDRKNQPLPTPPPPPPSHPAVSPTTAA